ncbi:MAG: histidine phosphatase family protein [Myxococcales bacterium]|nr:histidine phosphatase family protein [Myxococcales bacterium]MDH5306686.1 histidine phosphatase family protein [Myxococcales bacterium]MDH5565369.1 histidine phosphatase family protein [Myxococcales bacterium]
MSRLRRIVWLRHGDTVGESRTRFHGSGDVALSEEGQRQVREAAQQLRREVFDLIVASPLQRAWKSAAIVTGGAPIRLEPDFREIHFGRWEGMTADEIRASDPVLYEDWQTGVSGFEYPYGERRAAFRERVLRGFARLETSGAAHVLAVAHKGVIRTVVQHLVSEPLLEEIPHLAGVVSISRRPDGSWFVGRRGSDPSRPDASP